MPFRLPRSSTSAVLALALCAVAPSWCAAWARVSIVVDLSTQTMDVESTTAGRFHWKVSSGRRGFETPGGSFGVSRMDRDHRSKKYDDAPMPNAIFFQGGFAIHGAAVSAFGHPASHGCVRLSLAHSRELFDLVAAEGSAATTIRIVGSIDDVRPPLRIAREAADRGPYAYGEADRDDVPLPRFRPRPVYEGPEPLWPEGE